MNKLASRTNCGVEKVFRALAEPARLRIVNLLRAGELCVCDIVRVLGILQPAASRHLGYLRRVGLVVARRDSQWSYYRLAAPSNEFHRRLLECVELCAGQEADLLKDTRRLHEELSGGCLKSRCAEACSREEIA